MLLSECPEGLPFVVSFRGQSLMRYRSGDRVGHVVDRGDGMPKLLTTKTDHPAKEYTVIRRLFREDGDE